MGRTICLIILLSAAGLFFGGCSDYAPTGSGVPEDNSNMGSGMGMGMGMGPGNNGVISNESTPITPPPVDADSSQPVSTDPQSQQQSKSEPVLQGNLLYCDNYNLILFSMESGKRQALTKDGNKNVYYSSPSWIAQGKSILFILRTPKGSSIGRLSTEKGDSEIIFESSGIIGSATMSPDGKRIVYAMAESGAIGMMDADGSDQQWLPGVKGSDPVWSPDGTRIAFSYLVSGVPSAICTVKADGTELKELTKRFSVAGKHPSWAPDGRRIVFSTGRDICIVQADGTSLSYLTNDDTKYRDNPHWLPDGSKIVFEYRLKQNDESGFCVIDLSQNDERPISAKSGE